MVILAAGEGRRYGGIKQLAPIQNKPMLLHVMEHCRACPDTDLYVVLGAHEKAIRAQIDRGETSVLLNENWRDGIASSIRAATEKLQFDYDALCFIGGDQPFVPTARLQRMISCWQLNPDRIFCAAYGDTYGIPALFPQRYFTHLLELRGDQGAKSLLKEEGPMVEHIDIPEAAMDIDTPEQLAKYLNQLEARSG